MTLHAFREQFDTRFSEFLTQRIHAFTAQSESDDVKTTASYLSLIASGGKRFRPFLTYTALGNVSIEDHAELLFAVELLHVFALIHDDVMDNGSERHGVVCAQQKFSEVYGDRRIGDGVAILLGDLVYQWSYECMIAYTRRYTEHGDALLEIFSELIREVIHGQLIDVTAPTRPPLSKELIIQKMYLKTARYSFVNPIRLGMTASRNKAHLDFAEQYGTALGLMFQLQDDLLDSKGGAGKTTCSDIETNQQTLISWYMHHEAAPEYKKVFVSYVGKTMTQKDKEILGNTLDASGAFAYVQQQIDAYYQQAYQMAVVEGGVWGDIATMVYKRTS